LSAPESFVLLEGPAASGGQALKLALAELVARRRVVLRHVDRGLFRRRMAVLGRGAATPPGEGRLSAPLRTVLEVVLSVPERLLPDGTRGVRVEDVALAARRRFGSGSGYMRDVVLPSLAASGLSRRTTTRLFGIFPRVRYELTAEGERRKEELRDLVARAKGQSADPERAAAAIAASGAAGLLVPELIQAARRQREGAYGVAPVVAPGDGDASTPAAPDGGESPSAPTLDATPTPSASPTPEGASGGFPAPDLAAGMDLTAGGSAIGGLDLGALDAASIDAGFSGFDGGFGADGGLGGDGGGGGGDGGGS
jgi:hypothetical protein